MPATTLMILVVGMAALLLATATAPVGNKTGTLANHRCLPPNGKVFHVVIASKSGDPAAWLPWVSSLGLTHARVFVYIKQFRSLQFNKANLRLPCHMRLVFVALSSNMGHEAPSYMQHILEHHHDVPDAVMFAHYHGGQSWHTLPHILARRARSVLCPCKVRAPPSPHHPAATRKRRLLR